MVMDKATGRATETSVFDYYQKKYNVRLDKWQLPLLETQKRDVLFPMELAIMAPRQRYPCPCESANNSHRLLV